WTGEIYPAIRYVPPPVYAGSTQDFTFVWPIERGYADLADTLDRFAHPTVVRRSFVGFYRAPGSPEGRYTFRIEMRRSDRTLTADDIQDVRQAILRFFEVEGLTIA